MTSPLISRTTLTWVCRAVTLLMVGAGAVTLPNGGEELWASAVAVLLVGLPSVLASVLAERHWWWAILLPGAALLPCAVGVFPLYGLGAAQLSVMTLALWSVCVALIFCTDRRSVRALLWWSLALTAAFVWAQWLGAAQSWRDTSNTGLHDSFGVVLFDFGPPLWVQALVLVAGCGGMVGLGLAGRQALLVGAGPVREFRRIAAPWLPAAVALLLACGVALEMAPTDARTWATFATLIAVPALVLSLAGVAPRSCSVVLSVALMATGLLGTLTHDPLPTRESWLLALVTVFALASFLPRRRSSLGFIAALVVAGDVHDVLAHSLTVILAQGEGALASDPEEKDESLRCLVDVARTSLRDVRALIERLDGEDPDLPAPGLADLPALIDTFGSAGLPVTLSELGERAIPVGSTQLAIYRIVQEALTNALKHGGPGTSTMLTLDWLTDPSGLTLTVASAGPVRSSAPGTGRGLEGMRTRAAVAGGHLAAGAVPDARAAAEHAASGTTWLVSAFLPLSPQAQEVLR